MAEINIKSTEAEQRTLAKAVERLNSIEHIRYMSRTMLAETSGIKSTKVRVVLQDMLDGGLLEQYTVTDNPRLQRYYYTLTEAGRALLEDPADESQ